MINWTQILIFLIGKLSQSWGWFRFEFLTIPFLTVSSSFMVTFCINLVVLILNGCKQLKSVMEVQWEAKNLLTSSALFWKSKLIFPSTSKGSIEGTFMLFKTRLITDQYVLGPLRSFSFLFIFTVSCSLSPKMRSVPSLQIWFNFVKSVNVLLLDIHGTEAVVRRCSVEKVFLQISKNSQENTCVRVSFLIKLQVWGLHLYYKGGSGTVAFLWILRNF